MNGRLFSNEERALVVAEIGNNHEGSVAVAIELIERAAGIGVDAVKFQTFRTECFVRPGDRARYDRLKGFELSAGDFAQLSDVAHARGLLFFSTPLDLPSAAVLEPLVDAFKVASGDVTFTPLLRRIAASGKPVVLSSGASSIQEIRAAMTTLRTCWQERAAPRHPEMSVLHCVSCYPTEDAQASLGTISYLKHQIDVPIGYSDHTVGADAAVFAVALGACLVEKHFTLDKHYSDFRDHALSADPTELSTIVARIRKFEAMRGAVAKELQPCEREMRDAIRRSVVAAADLAEGHVLTEHDLTWMRPGTGLQPGSEPDLIGRALLRAVGHGEPLTLADLRKEHA
jgi:sialic acid synthase SpsE